MGVFGPRTATAKKTDVSAAEAKKHSRRPKDYAWTQQKLPAWQPIITFGTMWKFFLVLGLVFAILGGVMLAAYFSHPDEAEVTVTYYDGQGGRQLCTDCQNVLNEKCHWEGCKVPLPNCICTVKVKMNHKFKPPVYVYYEVDPFYQNHRSYVGSRDHLQLSGVDRYYENNYGKSGCGSANDPKLAFVNGKESGKIYFPCGALPNSMFTDRFSVKDPYSHQVELKTEGIAWKKEADKYGNPKKGTGNGSRQYTPLLGMDQQNQKHTLNKDEEVFNKRYAIPRNWTGDFWKIWWGEGGLKNPHFINWMHPAPSSKVRKLYGIINEGCRQTGSPYLCEGLYEIQIAYRYNVRPQKGSKRIIFTTTTWLGTKKRFFPVFTFGLGLFLLLCAIIFFALEKKTDVDERCESRIEEIHHNPNPLSDSETETDVDLDESYSKPRSRKSRRIVAAPSSISGSSRGTVRA